MKNIFKQSEESVTGLARNSFKKAVIRLTVYYAGGILIVLALFSLLIYGLFARNVTIEDLRPEIEDIESLVDDDEYYEDNLTQIRENLASILIFSDSFIFLVSIFLAYALAKKTLRPLEEAATRQARFVADAAHELRTPLAVLKAGSEVMLRQDRSTAEYKKFISEELDEVHRLSTLSNDLLFLANNRKKRSVPFSHVPLSKVCERQVEIMKPYALSKQVSLSASIENGLSVSGVQDDLTRLVINLLKNAIDYNKVDGSVVLSLQKRGSNVVLSCVDTGIGIAEKDRERIFERFFKADNARAQRGGSGTGLGLAIVKEIIEAHSGTIKVRSKLGEGTTFEVVFPGL
jgi:signal transduction histidine kinase